MEGFLKIIVYMVFTYFAVYIVGTFILLMLPFFMEMWYIFAFFGAMIVVAYAIGIYRSFQKKDKEE